MKKEDITKVLHDRGLKATSPRLKLLDAINDYRAAMPYSKIQEAMQPIDRVTLYRTLDSLLNKGVIHKAYESGNKVYYAICDHYHCSEDAHQHDHIHFKCNACNTVTCEVPAEDLRIALPGYQIQQVSISLEGICKA